MSGRCGFDVPHLSVGLGLRYMTPVGALRLDIGYRVPGAQWLSGTASCRPTKAAPRAWARCFGLSWLPVQLLNVALGEAL